MSRKDKPNNEKATRLRKWLVDHGVPNNIASKIIKTTRTMEEISDDLCSYLKARKSS